MRPHSSKSIFELEKLAILWANDHESLHELSKELRLRTTARARKLAAHVQEKLNNESAGGSDRQNGTGASGEQASSGAREDGVEIKRLKGQLAAARKKVSSLEDRVKELEQELAAERAKQMRQSSSSGPYAVVGVLDTIPDFAVAALKKAYQKAYHPDQCRDLNASDAHARFVKVMEAFHKIEARRNQ